MQKTFQVTKAAVTSKFREVVRHGSLATCKRPCFQVCRKLSVPCFSSSWKLQADTFLCAVSSASTPEHSLLQPNEKVLTNTIKCFQTPNAVQHQSQCSTERLRKIFALSVIFCFFFLADFHGIHSPLLADKIRTSKIA